MVLWSMSPTSESPDRTFLLAFYFIFRLTVVISYLTDYILDSFVFYMCLMAVTPNALLIRSIRYQSLFWAAYDTCKR